MNETSPAPSGASDKPEGNVPPLRRTARPTMDLIDYDGLPAGYGPEWSGSSAASTLTLVWRRKWLILGIFILIAAPALLCIWFFGVPLYEATAVVRITPVLDPIVFKSEKTGAIPFYQSYVNTQVSIILSPTVLERVLDRTEIQKTSVYGELQASWSAKISDRSSKPIEALKKVIRVQVRPGTELIDVSVSLPRPREAKEIANAVVAEYKNLSDEMHKASDINLFETLSRELKQNQMQIDGLIKTKFNISSQLGTLAPEELRAQFSMHLTRLQESRDQLVRENKMLQWQQAQLSGPSSMPASDDQKALARQLYSQDAEWRGMDRQLEDTRHQLELTRQDLGDAHPRLKKLQSQIEHDQKLLEKRQAELEESWEKQISQSTTMPEGMLSHAALTFLIHKKQREIELLDEEIERQNAKVAQAGEIAQEIARYDEEIQQLRDLKEAIRKRLEVLEMEGKAPARVRIAAYAEEPSSPARDRRLLFMALTLVGALSCGIGVSYLRSLMDKRIYEARELDQSFQSALLGVLPRIPVRELPAELGGGVSSAIENNMPRDGSYSGHCLMENMRMIRTTLLERVQAGGERTLLITSSLPSTGKTTVALLLAKSLAVVGKKVLLVEGDLRRPALAKRMQLTATAGLATVLTGEWDDAQAIVNSGLSNLDVLPAGAIPENFNTELLANGVFESCMERWKRHYDFILIDSPPLLPVADAQILASRAEGTVMVLRSSHDRKKEATEAYAQLKAAGGNLIGTVLIGGRFSQREGNRYAYTYDYYYYKSPPDKNKTD